jgi:hypothetical protein
VQQQQQQLQPQQQQEAQQMDLQQQGLQQMEPQQLEPQQQQEMQQQQPQPPGLQQLEPQQPGLGQQQQQQHHQHQHRRRQQAGGRWLPLGDAPMEQWFGLAQQHAVDDVGAEFPWQAEREIAAAEAAGQPLTRRQERQRMRDARKDWHIMQQVWAGICSEEPPRLAVAPAASDGVDGLEADWLQRIRSALRPLVDSDTYA